jgi:hypothetical protein
VPAVETSALFLIPNPPIKASDSGRNGMGQLFFFTIRTETQVVNVAQVVEYLPSKCEALSSNPNNYKIN